MPNMTLSNWYCRRLPWVAAAGLFIAGVIVDETRYEVTTLCAVIMLATGCIAEAIYATRKGG